MENPLLKDMRKDSPLYRALSASGQEQALKAARLLNAAIEARMEQEKIPPKVAGCPQCKGRLENPHADYVLPAPQIDSTKI